MSKGSGFARYKALNNGFTIRRREAANLRAVRTPEQINSLIDNPAGPVSIALLQQNLVGFSAETAQFEVKADRVKQAAQSLVKQGRAKASAASSAHCNTSASCSGRSQSSTVAIRGRHWVSSWIYRARSGFFQF